MQRASIFAATCLALATAALVVPAAHAEGRVRGRAVVQNPEGGAVARTGAAASGPRGAMLRGRTVSSDGNGNVSGRSGAAFRGANGSTAARAGSFQRNADGSASRQGSAAFTGPNGASGRTDGTLARDADGNITGQRDTTATGANGGTYAGSTTRADGTTTRTATCTNAAGDVVACPRPRN